MTLRFAFVPVAAVAILCSAPVRDAVACGSQPAPSNWTVTETLPSAGGVIPPDGALVVRAIPWPALGGGHIPVGSMVVTEEGSAEPIPGDFVEWYGDQPSAAWHPLVPFEPNSRYEVTVSLEWLAEPMGVEDSTAFAWEFSTTDHQATPLALEGSLEIVLEDYNRDITECDYTDCGPHNCRITGHEPAVRARITLPTARGGYSADGYRGWLHYTANTPQSFDGPGYGRQLEQSEINVPTFLELNEGESREIVVPLLEEAETYEPCFAMNVWDSAGKSVQASSRCIGPFEPPASRKGASDSGCTMTSRAPPGIGSALAWLSLLLLGCMRSRLGRGS